MYAYMIICSLALLIFPMCFRKFREPSRNVLRYIYSFSKQAELDIRQAYATEPQPCYTIASSLLRKFSATAGLELIIESVICQLSLLHKVKLAIVCF